MRQRGEIINATVYRQQADNARREDNMREEGWCSRWHAHIHKGLVACVALLAFFKFEWVPRIVGVVKSGMVWLAEGVHH